MNKKINELAFQAEVWNTDGDYDKCEVDLEVFAQLIVNECCDVVINSDPSPKMILHEPYRTIINNIQEHFGVEK